MLKEIILLSAIFTVSSLSTAFTVLLSPAVGVLASGILGYILYLLLGRL